MDNNKESIKDDIQQIGFEPKKIKNDMDKNKTIYISKNDNNINYSTSYYDKEGYNKPGPLSNAESRKTNNIDNNEKLTINYNKRNRDVSSINKRHSTMFLDNSFNINDFTSYYNKEDNSTLESSKNNEGNNELKNNSNIEDYEINNIDNNEKLTINYNKRNRDVSSINKRQSTMFLDNSFNINDFTSYYNKEDNSTLESSKNNKGKNELNIKSSNENYEINIIVSNEILSDENKTKNNDKRKEIVSFMNKRNSTLFMDNPEVDYILTINNTDFTSSYNKKDNNTSDSFVNNESNNELKTDSNTNNYINNNIDNNENSKNLSPKYHSKRKEILPYMNNINCEVINDKPRDVTNRFKSYYIKDSNNMINSPNEIYNKSSHLSTIENNRNSRYSTINSPNSAFLSELNEAISSHALLKKEDDVQNNFKFQINPIQKTEKENCSNNDLFNDDDLQNTLKDVFEKPENIEFLQSPSIMEEQNSIQQLSKSLNCTFQILSNIRLAKFIKYSYEKIEEIISHCKLKEVNNVSEIVNDPIYHSMYKIFLEKEKVDELEEFIPKMKEICYNRYGWFGGIYENFHENINKRYKNNLTLLHNEASNTIKNDYIEVIVSLIKMGSNLTLIDDNGQTPLDIINEENLDKIYKNLEKALKSYKVDSSVGLRICRGLVEIGIRKNKRDYLKTYFDGLLKYLKRTSRNENEIYYIFDQHIWHDENKILRKERQEYFNKLFNENRKKIESNIDRQKANDENIIIEKFLFEDSNQKFNILKENIRILIKIALSNHNLKSLNEIIFDDYIRFIKEYPYQINMELENKSTMLETLIEQNNIPLIELLVKNGVDLDEYMSNGKLPLEQALENKNKELVIKLIELKAFLDAPTKSGKKISEIILETGDPNLIYYLNKDKYENNSTIVDEEENNENNNSSQNSVSSLETKNNIIKDLQYELTSNIKDINHLKLPILTLTINQTNNEMIKFINSDAKKANTTPKTDLIKYINLSWQYINEGDFDNSIKIVEKCNEVLEWQYDRGINLLSKMILMLKNNEDLEKVEDMIEKNKFIINNEKYVINQWNHSTPLHYIIGKIKQTDDALIILEKIISKIDNYAIMDIIDDNNLTALDFAIAINKMDAVKLLYRRNMNLKKNKFTNRENIVHLQYSLLNDNINSKYLKKIIEEIVDLRQDENERNITFCDIINDNSISKKQNLLHIAIALEKWDIVEYLLNQNEIDLCIKDSKGRSALIYAIISQYEYEKIKNMIEKNEKILRLSDNLGASPLHYAVLIGNINIINLLLHSNKDLINEKDINQKTPFHYAAQYEALNVIEILMSYNIKSINDDTDDNGLRPVDYLLLKKLEDKPNKEGNTISNTIQQLISKIDESENYRECRRNILHTACQNIYNPEKAIDIVLNALSARESRDSSSKGIIKNLVTSPLKTFEGPTPIELALENNVNKEYIKKLVYQGEIENNQKLKDKLLEKIYKCNREDVVQELKWGTYYDDKFNTFSLDLLLKIKQNKKNIKNLMEIFDIPVDDEDSNNKYQLYELIIIKDNFFLFAKLAEDIQIEKNINNIKYKVIYYSAKNILKGLLKQGIEFNDKLLWKTATKEIRKLILDYYIENNILEEETKKAAKQSNISMVKMVLDLDIENKAIISGLLLKAIETNDLYLAKAVIDKKGKDIFNENDENLNIINSILNKYYKNEEIITYLIMRGAKLQKLNYMNSSKIVSINQIIDKATSLSKLINSDINSFKKEIKSISSKEINEPDKLGNTIIFYVIRCNDFEKVKMILRKNEVKIDIRNKYGETPLYIAIRYASKKIVQLIIEKSNIYKHEVRSKSMLHYALKRKGTNEEWEKDEKDSIAYILMEKGVLDLTPSTINKLICDSHYRDLKLTQLMYHIMKGNKKEVDELLNNVNIDLEVQDNEKMTAYGYALSKRYNDIAKKIEEKAEHLGKKLPHKAKNFKNIFGIYNKKKVAAVLAGTLFNALGLFARTTDTGAKIFGFIDKEMLKYINKNLNEEEFNENNPKEYSEGLYHSNCRFSKLQE